MRAVGAIASASQGRDVKIATLWAKETNRVHIMVYIVGIKVMKSKHSSAKTKGWGPRNAQNFWFSWELEADLLSAGISLPVNSTNIIDSVINEAYPKAYPRRAFLGALAGVGPLLVVTCSLNIRIHSSPWEDKWSGDVLQCVTLHSSPSCIRFVLLHTCGEHWISEAPTGHLSCDGIVNGIRKQVNTHSAETDPRSSSERI